MADSRTLFKELQVGDMKLAHRLALAPLTRFRANDKHVVQGGLSVQKSAESDADVALMSALSLTDLHTTYYTQRGSTPGTLLISEATLIAPQAGGYTYAPGIWNEEQIAAWKKVVDGVHAQGSFLCQQLWSMGRGANLTSLAAEPTGPYDVVSASNIPFEGGATPRPLSVDEIKEFVGWYAQAAKNFVKLAGGDMVESKSLFQHFATPLRRRWLLALTHLRLTHSPRSQRFPPGSILADQLKRSYRQLRRIGREPRSLPA